MPTEGAHFNSDNCCKANTLRTVYNITHARGNKYIRPTHLTFSSDPSFTFISSMLFSIISSLYLGPNHSKYPFHGRLWSIVSSIPSAQAVSYVHTRATFFTV